VEEKSQSHQKGLIHSYYREDNIPGKTSDFHSVGGNNTVNFNLWNKKTKSNLLKCLKRLLIHAYVLRV
jgi:hypothetical protein